MPIVKPLNRGTPHYQQAVDNVITFIYNGPALSTLAAVQWFHCIREFPSCIVIIAPHAERL